MIVPVTALDGVAHGLQGLQGRKGENRFPQKRHQGDIAGENAERRCVLNISEPTFFTKAVAAYLFDREPRWTEKTRKMHANSLAHLRHHFLKLLVQDVNPEHVSRYQRVRLKEGAAPRTVNVEVALVRLVLRKHKRWAAISDEVKMLHERQDVGRALSADEQVRLFTAASH